MTIKSQDQFFKEFAEATNRMLAIGYEQVANDDAEFYEKLMGYFADEKAMPRIVITFDHLYATIDVDAIGVTTEDEKVCIPIFSYRMAREIPKGAN